MSQAGALFRLIGKTGKPHVEDDMFSWLIRRKIDAFEKAYDYDMSYMRDVLESDPAAARLFAQASAIGRYRKGVPAAAWYAAKLAGLMAEDCGPCTQLVIKMAEREGVAASTLRAIVARDAGAMPEPVALAYRFADAALKHDAAADGLREQIVARWGKKALVSLGFAVTAARLYPTLKYAMGHGQACTRVTVGGAPVPVLRRAA
jgi:hypothetical protein